MAFAILADLADGSDPEKLLDQAAWWLKTWFMDFGDLEALAADNEDLAEGLKIVSCAMVNRRTSTKVNEGVQSTYQVMGPISAQIAFRDDTGKLYITTAERDAILAHLGVDVSGAVSMTGPGL
jgi:hypothetical protein